MLKQRITLLFPQQICSGHEDSKTSATQLSEGTTAAGKITTQPETDNWANNLVTETASSPSSTPSGQNELQAAEQDNTLQNASQYGLLQVAISSLVVLAVVCITVCAIMVTVHVFIVACKRNTPQFTHILAEVATRNYLMLQKHTVRLKKSRSTLLWKSSCSITVLYN